MYTNSQQPTNRPVDPRRPVVAAAVPFTRPPSSRNEFIQLLLLMCLLSPGVAAPSIATDAITNINAILKRNAAGATSSRTAGRLSFHDLTTNATASIETLSAILATIDALQKECSDRVRHLSSTIERVTVPDPRSVEMIEILSKTATEIKGKLYESNNRLFSAKFYAPVAAQIKPDTIAAVQQGARDMREAMRSDLVPRFDTLATDVRAANSTAGSAAESASRASASVSEVRKELASLIGFVKNLPTGNDVAALVTGVQSALRAISVNNQVRDEDTRTRDLLATLIESVKKHGTDIQSLTRTFDHEFADQLAAKLSGMVMTSVRDGIVGAQPVKRTTRSSSKKAREEAAPYQPKKPARSRVNPRVIISPTPLTIRLPARSPLTPLDELEDGEVSERHPPIATLEDDDDDF